MHPPTDAGVSHAVLVPLDNLRFEGTVLAAGRWALCCHAQPLGAQEFLDLSNSQGAVVKD
jgi:hypothetical protein